MSEDKQKTEKSNADKKPNKALADEKAASASASTPPDSSPHKAAKKNEPHHKKRQRKPSGTSMGLFSGVISLIIIGGLLAGGWYGYQILLKTQQSIDEVQQSQTALVEQNRDYESELNSRFGSMLKQQQELADYIEVLREKDQHLRKDWLLLESEYLIQLANYRLLFERDINTAMAALSAADTRLRDTGDPGLINVRKSIAEAVQALKQIPQADLAGLSLTLSAINKDIDKLSLKTPDPKSKANQQQEMQESKQVESWSELPAAMWNDIKNLIVIRDHEAPIQPLLSPEERFFLVENLRLQIEQARLAMLSGQSTVYKERLTTAIGWIDEHFDKSLPLTTSTLDTLNKLANESIAPELPNIAYTYQALQTYRLGQQAPKVQDKLVPPAKSKSTKPDSKKPEAEKPEAVKPEVNKPETKQPEIKAPATETAPARTATGT